MREERMSYKSKAVLFGLPLVHVSGGEPAVGFIAVGQIAYGFITIGQFGVGIIFGLGQFMAGAITIAQFSLGALFSVGQFSFGWHSLGFPAIGYEGVFGLHFVERNFLSGFINLNGVIFAAVFFLLFAALCAGCVYLLKAGRTLLVRGSSATSDPHSKRKKINNENPRLSPFQFAKVTVVMITMFAAWQILHADRIDRVLNEDKVVMLNEKGKEGTAVIQEVHIPFLQFAKAKTVLLNARVSPVNTEIDPYEAEIIVSRDVDYSFREGMKIRVRYDPSRKGDVIFAGIE
jgi:hypothetical protein